MRKDLNLTQWIQSVAVGSYSDFVTEVLEIPLSSASEIYYRQAIFRDLEDAELYQELKAFTKTMDHVDSQLQSLERLVYDEQRESCFLHILYEYCNAIDRFYETLVKKPRKSEGLQMVVESFQTYVQSKSYQSLNQDSQELIERISQIRYSITFDGYTIKVSNSVGATDYSAELLQLFQKFLCEGKRKGHCRRLQNDINMNTVEYRILQCVRKMHPKIFKQIHEFMPKYQGFRDDVIETFRREVQFYIDYLEYIEPLKVAENRFTYPNLVEQIDETKIYDGYDLVLAQKLVREQKLAVVNDFECRSGERVFVVTGPNQGGKTTFSRMVGQIHYLSVLGVPVPAKKADVMIANGIFTHFEHEEVAYNDNGKLQDDLLRMREICENLTRNCLIIMNEMLSSTSYQDAIEIGEKIVQRLEDTECISIYVTFVDELVRIDKNLVSLASLVDDTKNGHRTFKIKRQTTDGLVYAKSLADKYNLSYAQITERLKKNR